MKKSIGKYHKKLAAALIIAVLCGIIITGELAGVLDFAEFRVYDLKINFFTRFFTRPRSQDITIVLMQQACLDWGQATRGWGWPWPREAYAQLLDYMKLSGAKSVSFDMIFSEPSVYRNPRQDEIIERAVRNIEIAEAESTEDGVLEARGQLFREIIADIQALGERVDDASFAGAARNFGRVTQTVFIDTQQRVDDQPGRFYSWPEALNTPVFNLEGFDADISRFALTGERLRSGRVLTRSPAETARVSAQFPIRELRDSAAVIGSVTGQPDPDNIYRRNRLFTLFDGRAVPGLSAAALIAAGHDTELIYDPARRQIRWGDFRIPVDNNGKTLLRFRGPLTLYPNYRMSEVLQSAEDYAAGRVPLIEPEQFAGSYVFFGVFGPGFFDIAPNPIAANYPGIGMHVTMLDNMLMGDFIQQAPVWVSIFIIAASIILIVILVLFSPRISLTVAGFITSIITLIIAGFWAFHFGWWIPIAAPIFAVLLAYLTATLFSYATEGKDKRFIKHAFSRILSPKVIDGIIADPSQLKLGGERRKMTAIFTDIQRFSSISSELQDQYGEDGPTVLVNLLNLYLTEMSNIVMDNGGTIDKYEGDAIIAFFGAPVWLEDHAARACRSAIQMKKREKELKEKIMDPAGEFYAPLNKLIEDKVIPCDRPLFTRLGINTGDMVVGFMGTPAKMDYTIMGNAVNLAARLEGVNKQYDTNGILISEYTRDQIGEEFVIRPLSRVTVFGIPVPLRLYEVFDIKKEASSELIEMVNVWGEAFKFYESRDFAAAKKLFAELSERDPSDKVAKRYLGKCELFAVTPPPANWDAVDNLTEK